MTSQDFASDQLGGGMAGNCLEEEDVQASTRLSREGQEASVVAASVIDLLCESKGLNQLITRVSMDWARDEGIFLLDYELVYYDLLGPILAYNRYKLMAQKAQFEKEGRRKGGSGEGWVPDLRNMVEATSTISLNHYTHTMEELSKTKRFVDIVRPMAVFKEIICYTRLQLESANPGHRDYAVVTLYRLFYCNTTDRRDPLPRLLGEWKAGVFTKKHTAMLVELVYEVMKTLDLARSIFSDETKMAAAKKARGKKSSMSIDQYENGAYSFDADEYFKKLITNSSVRMVTMLLEVR